jgi:hypothetical protein
MLGKCLENAWKIPHKKVASGINKKYKWWVVAFPATT